ncbi:TPA: hypothetical protein ACH2LV_003523, partial [Vibrio cholerae]
YKYVFRSYNTSLINIDCLSIKCPVPLDQYKISEDHFKTWGRIVYFLTKVAKGDDIESNMIAVLQKIKKFDEKTEEVFGDLS